MLPSQKEGVMGSLKKKKQQPKLIKLYAFLWHVNVEEMMITEGASGYYCESAKTEKPTKEEAEQVLKEWLNKRMKNCKNNKCEHTTFITTEVTPKMHLSGMTKNMVNI